MTRKTFLASSIGGAGLLLTGGILRNLPSKELTGKLTIDAVQKQLDAFKQKPALIKTTGAWSAFRSLPTVRKALNSLSLVSPCIKESYLKQPLVKRPLVFLLPGEDLAII